MFHLLPTDIVRLIASHALVIHNGVCVRCDRKGVLTLNMVLDDDDVKDVVYRTIISVWRANNEPKTINHHLDAVDGTPSLTPRANKDPFHVSHVFGVVEEDALADPRSHDLVRRREPFETSRRRVFGSYAHMTSAR